MIANCGNERGGQVWLCAGFGADSLKQFNESNGSRAVENVPTRIQPGTRPLFLSEPASQSVIAQNEWASGSQMEPVVRDIMVANTHHFGECPVASENIASPFTHNGVREYSVRVANYGLSSD